MDLLAGLSEATMKPLSAAQKVEKARATAQQFEELLVRTLVTSMRATADLGGEGGGLFGSETGADTFGDWFDQHVSEQVSKNGNVGVADVLMREFERWKQIPSTERAANLDEVAQDALRHTSMPPRGQGGLDVAG
jgi:Rod binding domain-containing protein